MIQTRRKIAWVAVAAVLAVGRPAAGQQAPDAAPRERAGPEVRVVRVESSALRLDGRLDEPAWIRARPATGFTQREPEEGAAATEATEVRFAYDNRALWIGARMHSRDPSAIVALVSRRDQVGQSEELIVSLDTYRDRRTAYSFGVTPAGVRVDYYHDSDYEDHRDYGYDPVWQVRTSLDGDGWVAEIRIPFSQLRFDDAGSQTWGVNLTRRVPARNEDDYWVLVGRNETGWSSRMGTLTGLHDIRRGRGIELLPYMAANADIPAQVDPADPFTASHAESVRVGADLKVGLGPNLTLDATINPNFGQVEADPAEVNLSAYETFFDERRPFFTEGAQLFGNRGLFYSRRIGAPPPGRADAEYAESVDNTTILGAAKLTGRLASGLSLGALSAVTAEESVRTFDVGTESYGTAVVAPLTYYGVASAQQELGADGSTISAMVTGVHRSLDAGSGLADLVVGDAVSGIVDGRWRWAGGRYDMSVYIGFTRVTGSEAAVLRLQRSSRRYWQRPDASHVRVDSTRTSMTGTTLGINHSKLAGDWLWNVDYYQESPGLEPNDIGALGGADDRGLSADIRYRETDPGPIFRAWSVGAGQTTEWTFGGERQYTFVYPFANFTLPNFWRINLDVNSLLGGYSDALTRGGPLMAQTRTRRYAAEIQNASGARTRWDLEVEVGNDDHDGTYFRLEPGLSFRPGTRWSLSLNPGWEKWAEPRQLVQSRDNGPAETFGRRYVFAYVDRSEVAARIRLNYTFTPDLSLESYIEPFAASGHYHTFGELVAARSGELRVYGEAGGTTLTGNGDGSYTVGVDGQTFDLGPLDYNVRSLRSNVVLRWEWRPGSTAYLVWQQNGFVARDPARVGPGDLADALGTRSDQFLAVKVSYWLPVG